MSHRIHARALVRLGLVLLSGCVSATLAQTPAPAPAASPPAGAASTAASTEKFTFGDGTVRLPFGVSGGEHTFIVAAEGLSKEGMEAKGLTIVDVPVATPALKSTVKFTVDAELPPSTASRRWVVTATASGLVVNDEQARYATLEFGGSKRTLPYALTNRVRAAPDFTVTVNTPWKLTGDDDADTVTVVTGEQAIQGLRLSNSTLTEKTNGDPLRTQHFQLCLNQEKSCEPPGVLSALTTHTLYLRYADGARPHGRFSGTLAFAANARPDAKVVTVEANSSSLPAKIVGAAVIVVGVALAWLLTLWSRNRLDRLAALRPALEARRRILDLLERLGAACPQAGVDFVQLRARYADHAASLTEEQLDREGLLPARLPGTTAVVLTELKARLKALEQPIIGLTVIVREGVEPLARDWNKAPDAEKPQIVKALRTLDSPDDAAVEDKAKALVAKAMAMAAPIPPAGMAAVKSGTAKEAAVELQEVNSQIEGVNMAIWWVYLLLVSVTGAAVLVVGNLGFGTTMDFVYCLLWGFGLPTTMDKLQAATPASVSTALGIKLPTS